MTSLISVDPHTGETFASYPSMTGGELGDAARRSHEAFSAWRREPLEDRLACLSTLAKRLEEDASRLGELATREMGKPVTQATQEVEKCALACRYYAENAPRILADERIATEAKASYVAFEPLGPVLCVMPWNFPYWQVIRFAAPALAAGNTVLLKHAENMTGVAFEIERLYERAGFPANVLQTLRTEHGGVADLIADAHVRAVTLTGSERAGKAVAQAAGAHLKKAVLELGGSDAYVVLADADLRAAAATCVAARLTNSGQSCVAAKRFIVDEAVYDEFARAFVEVARQKVVGDPRDPATAVGPLAKASIRDEVRRQTAASLAAGARELYRSETPRGGFYHPIVVLGDVEPGMPAFDEEVFGPVAALVRARGEDDAFELANRSRYGLGGAVFSRDVERAERLARGRLEAGFVVVNGMVRSDPRLPFGGVKASGYGRELGSFGLREFVNVKTVVLA